MPNRPLFRSSRFLSPRRPLITLLVAACLAVWLLWQPHLLQSLPWMLRLPLVALGVWALGAAFVLPVTLSVGEGWLWRLALSAWSRAALVVFALMLMARALLG